MRPSHSFLSSPALYIPTMRKLGRLGECIDAALLSLLFPPTLYLIDEEDRKATTGKLVPMKRSLRLLATMVSATKSLDERSTCSGTRYSGMIDWKVNKHTSSRVDRGLFLSIRLFGRQCDSSVSRKSGNWRQKIL